MNVRANHLGAVLCGVPVRLHPVRVRTTEWSCLEDLPGKRAGVTCYLLVGTVALALWLDADESPNWNTVDGKSGVSVHGPRVRAQSPELESRKIGVRVRS